MITKQPDQRVRGMCAAATTEGLDQNDPKTRDIVPTGRCLNCGDDVYRGEPFCSKACGKDFEYSLTVG